jgi:hypothetical protein
MDVQQLADGLWRWTAQEMGSVYYEAPDAIVLFDPLVPAGEEEKFLAYLDRDVEGLELPVSILLTAPERERSAPFLRERYDASDRIPDSVEAYPVEERTAYVIRPHRALVVDARDRALVIEDVPVELVLALS